MAANDNYVFDNTKSYDSKQIELILFSRMRQQQRMSCMAFLENIYMHSERNEKFLFRKSMRCINEWCTSASMSKTIQVHIHAMPLTILFNVRNSTPNKIIIGHERETQACGCTMCAPEFDSACIDLNDSL